MRHWLHCQPLHFLVILSILSSILTPRNSALEPLGSLCCRRTEQFKEALGWVQSPDSSSLHPPSTTGLILEYACKLTKPPPIPFSLRPTSQNIDWPPYPPGCFLSLRSLLRQIEVFIKTVWISFLISCLCQPMWLSKYYLLLFSNLSQADMTNPTFSPVFRSLSCTCLSFPSRPLPSLWTDSFF